ncbi:glycosyltransferase [Bradyrhizobium sp. Tv2a-2]|uniref:glycosyltransferase n=1 Tax=Bradyrhizobium sp. Tv2a-2 TaxID=113395 RepID=UPI0018DDF682|nr:glycosyltransferase [Bradyrhizobium sp. Tv2a-2]
MLGGSGVRMVLRIARRVAGHVAAWTDQNELRQQSAASGTDASGPNASDFFVSQVRAEIPKVDGPIFWVVIPTMDRAATVADTIRTCLAQEDVNLRIVVSDNASIDNTAEVVKSFADSRLSYINPGHRLGMSEHWEYALTHVGDGYVTVLGDDDGLLPGAVSAARQMIAKYDTQAFSWRKVEYCWPDHIAPSFRNWLQIPLGTDIRRMKSLDVVGSVVEFRDSYTKLPCIYNSFISIDLIRSYQAKNGGIFFGGSNPDIFSAFAIASEVEEFVFCQRPLSINGAGSKSNGTLQTVGDKDDGLAKSFWADTKFTFEPGIPQAPVVEFCIIDSFMKVQKVAECFSPDLVDKKLLIQSAVGGTFGGHIPASRRADRLESLREYARTEGLLELFEETCDRYARINIEPGLPKPGYYEPDIVVFDASSMGVDNVYSASLRVAEILNLKAVQEALFRRLTETRRPELAIALFARSNGSPLRLHLGCGAAHFSGYVNVDNVDFPQSERVIMTVVPDVVCDIARIDLPENSVKEIRLHHVFEHLSRAVALASLIKWQGWLEIGGELRIETPDFEASARDFLNANSVQEKLRAIRHLEGDQVGGWAYHVGQWFPERFDHTMRKLGFGEVYTRQEASAHTPPLRNVIAIGRKTAFRLRSEQFEAGCELLRDFMVADGEISAWEAWKNQLSTILDEADVFPAPNILSSEA